MTEAAPQREHLLRAIFNALRWMVRADCPWRLLPRDLPRWTAVHHQTLRWIRAGFIEAMAHDLRMVLRELSERASQPTAVFLDGRTVQSSGGYLGASAGLESHPGHRTGTRSSRRTGAAGAGRDRALRRN